MLGLGTLGKKVFGTANDRKVKSVRPLVQKINDLEPEFEALSDEGIKAKTEELVGRVANGESLDDILPEAFANCREAARRALHAACTAFEQHELDGCDLVQMREHNRLEAAMVGHMLFHLAWWPFDRRVYGRTVRVADA